MTTETTVFSYKDVRCLTDSTGAVSAIDFTFVATQGELTLSNRTLFRYDQPAYTDDSPFLSFDDWRAQKLYPLLDALVELYKWKTDLLNKLTLMKTDQTLTYREIEETKSTSATTADATATETTGASDSKTST